jgi:hypothetical protein
MDVPKLQSLPVENARCNHNVNDGVITSKKIIRIVKLLRV